jgi:hypothetical protein
VYFTSTDGELYCVDATSSGPSPKLQWSQTVGDTWSSPAVSDGRVIVGSRETNTVYCFNATKGTLKWSYDAGDDIYSSPAIADGKVVIAVRGSPETILCFGGGTSPPPPPAPPTNLQAQLSGGGIDVTLTWDASSDDGAGDDDVTGYTVYRSETGVNGVYEYTDWIPATGSPTYSWTDPGAGDGDANNYFYIVRAKDDLNTEEENVNKVGKVVYDLPEGWNLISIPLEQKDTLKEIVLQTIEGNYKAIQTYHAGSLKPWLHWHSDKPKEMNHIDDIDHIRGYYIKMINSDNLVVVGKVRDSTQISLRTGWNLVGYPYLESQIRDSALSSILGSFDRAQSYNPVTKTYGFLGPNDNMSPGMGYWIHATEDCIWSG